MSASSAGKKRKFSDESDAELEASSFKSGEQQSTVLQWNAPTLQENGIFYAVEPVGIQVIWDTLKKDRYVQVVENPSVTGLFMAIMKKCLDFSIEIDSVFQNQDLESAWKWYDNRQIELDECMNLVTNLCWRPIDHVQEQCSISPLCSSDNQLCSGLLHIWLGHALEFLRSTKDLMMLVAEATDTHIKDNEKRNRKGKQSVSDSALADSFVPIAEYREIIMRYTRLLFLEPK
ncbi:hypothetical protein FSP39_013164 [Pinctada imbricata]|uniref:Uncharacterized protein n=1 Tax=Pinctada imbricata TaxID=66713 RepID=A0AA88XMB8_PINIB|nr:hypothetical protein FSP39_013164 [Pinctada imbricata]